MSEIILAKNKGAALTWDVEQIEHFSVMTVNVRLDGEFGDKEDRGYSSI